HPFAHTLLLFPPYADHRDAHSFPTRRSSDLGIVDLDDLLQRLHVRKADIVEEAAAQESVGQFLFVVGSDDDDRAMRGANCLARLDRKSTRLNSSHVKISYAVFCLKKKRAEQ